MDTPCISNDPRRRHSKETGGAWGDTHHPAPSETNGIYDGKYLWINDLANGRLARVRLDVLRNRSHYQNPEHAGRTGDRGRVAGQRRTFA